MQHFSNITDYNKYIGYHLPKKDLIDVVCYDDYKQLRLSSPEISTAFYTMAFKKQIGDLNCYGNTTYDDQSGFLYFIKPNQKYQWEANKPWKGHHIMVSPILLQEYNINFSFFDDELTEALFLTSDEQNQIVTLYKQILVEYQKDNYELDLLIAYCNLIFTYVGKCYKRQFNTRQPLYNNVVVEFKTLLNSYYKNDSNPLPTVHYFAEKLNLSTNYFGDLIKHHTGKTASEVIQEKIVSEAKQRLQNSNKTIAEIGYTLGFEYPTYFSRLFKKHTGKTPSQYRY